MPAVEDKFLWGAAISAHQVEGGNFNNDWWLFEKAGMTFGEGTSHPSCDFFHHYKSDINLLGALGCNAFRFSVEWSRVVPSPGEVSAEAVEFYRDLIFSLRASQITPLVTLHHFTNPVWVAEAGGWENEGTVDSFLHFVETVVGEFGEEVYWWLTVNEPNVLLLLGYLLAYWPPLVRNVIRFRRALRNLIEAHRRAYDLIHQLDSSCAVGFAHNMTIFEPWRTALDKVSSQAHDYLWNKLLLDKTRDKLDFLGVNYYTRQRVSFPLKTFPHPEKRVGFAEWEEYPAGLYRCLKRVKKNYQLPVLVTEYGMPHGLKVNPVEYLQKGWGFLKNAMREGCDVRGFFYWSLLDNFEWREGLAVRFGLYKVNFNSQERTLREVGRQYAKLIEQIGLDA